MSIAGSDCSGGAGIQADLKTISALGAYAATAITAITVQNLCLPAQVPTRVCDFRSRHGIYQWAQADRR